MVAYRWDGTLETGHEIIDTQHKQLFEAINDLLGPLEKASLNH